MPLPSENLLNDLISWQSQCAINGQYSGTINLLNRSGQHTNAIWTAIKASINSNLISRGITDTDNCFAAGIVDWIYGLVDSIELPETDVTKAATLQIRSFFSGFGKKPINTYYYNTDADDVISEILSAFMGVTASLYDLSGLTNINNVMGIVSGANCLEELKKLAEATEADLYVNRSGIMVATNWKDFTDPVDVVIPPQAIMKASKGNSTSAGPSVITVRGRFISQVECGLQCLNCGPNPLEPKENQPPQITGERKCISVGIENRPSLETKLNKKGLKGKIEDWKNATVEVIDLATQEVVSIGLPYVNKDGTLNSVFLVGSDGGVTVQSLESQGYAISINGMAQPEQEHTDANSKQKPLKQQIARSRKILSNLAMQFNGDPQTIDFWDVFVKMGQGDTDKFGDEQEPLRLQMFLVDTDLFDEFGYHNEEVDNLYLADFETLFDVAVRKFQEFKIRRNSWRLDTVYLPCLELNQTVQFVSPKGTTVTGRLSSITVNYNPQPQARMTLTVDSFEDIGSTVYTSGNLFLCPLIPGTNDQTWIKTETGEGFVKPRGGLCGIGVLDGVGEAELKQSFSMEIGASYILQFTITKYTGTGDFEVYVTDGSGDQVSQTYSTDGTKTINFTPDERFNSIRFVISTQNTSWYVSRPVLVKQVTR